MCRQLRLLPASVTILSKRHPRAHGTRRGANGKCVSQSLQRDRYLWCIAVLDHHHQKRISDNSKI
eukprot:663791-Pyramimonas_sp.AAC.1